MTDFIKAFVLPPGGPILLGVLGLLLMPWWRTTGWRLILVSVLASYFCSIGLTARLLARAVQSVGPLSEFSMVAGRPGAIVVLGGGVQPEAPEYGGATVHPRTLARVRYAAALARRTGLGILASGGEWTNAAGVQGIPEAQLMGQLLREEFGIVQVLTETASHNTRENARFSARMLKGLGIDRVLLVTQAAHMPRAAMLFERSGIQVVPAPTLFFASDLEPWHWFSWIPSASASYAIYYLCYEALGLVWDLRMADQFRDQ